MYAGLSTPNTPNKPLLSQRLIHQALEFAKTSNKPSTTSSSNHQHQQHQHQNQNQHQHHQSAQASSGQSTTSSKGQPPKSRLRQRFWLSSKPILTRAVS